MTDKELGLATLKPEGGTVYIDGESTDNTPPSETRWIEMCYDPDEPVNGSTLDNLDACIRGLPEDEKYILIKALANLHITEGGF